MVPLKLRRFFASLLLGVTVAILSGVSPAEGQEDRLPNLPLRFSGNVVLLDEVYVSVLVYAGWDQAPSGPARATWIRETLEAFLHRSGYELGSVAAQAHADGSFDIEIDEGRLDKIIFRNQDPWTTVRLIFMLDLPGRVYNSYLVERRLERVRERLQLGQVSYSLVPTEKPAAARLKLGGSPLIEGMTLLDPGEPHELRVSFAQVDRREGFDLGLGIQAPDGIILRLRYGAVNVFMPNDRLETLTQFGVRLTDIGEVDTNPAGISKAGAEVNWFTPPVGFDFLRFVTRLSADMEARRRDDLELANYFFLPVHGALGLEVEADSFRLAAVGGLEYRSFFGSAANEGQTVAVLDVTEGSNLRSFVGGRLHWVMNPDRLRRDQPHEVELVGRYLWPVIDANGEILEADLRYHNTIRVAFDEIRYGLRGTWLSGTVPFYSERSMGDGFLRSAFQGTVFARRIGAINLEYRLSLSRDDLKVSLFNDLAVYDALNDIRDSTGVSVIDNFGFGLHILILDAFQVDGYAGMGVRSDGEIDLGLSLGVSQAY